MRMCDGVVPNCIRSGTIHPLNRQSRPEGIPESYEIGDAIREKKAFSAFLKQCVDGLRLVDQGVNGVFRDCFDMNGLCTMNGKPHGIYQLVGADKNISDQVVFV
jgi:hypothetical protein